MIYKNGDPLDLNLKLFLKVVEDAPDGMRIFDLNGYIIYTNRAEEDMYGYSQEEFKEKHISEFNVDPEFASREIIPNVKKTGRWAGEIMARRKDGKEFPILLTISTVKNSEGEPIALLGIDRDIIGHKRMQKALEAAILKAEEEKNKSEAIITAIGDGIIIQDTNYKIIYQNKIQNDIYGNHVGEYCYKAYEGRDTICEGCPVEISFRDGKIHRAERSSITDRGILHIEITGSPLRDSTGNIIAGIKVIRDITERKRAEEELQEKERFLASIFSSIQDGIGILDKDMNIIRVNPTVEKWYSHAMPLVGKKCYEAFHRRSEPCEICSVRRTFETGKATCHIIPKSGPGGEDIGWMEIHSFPMIDMTTGQMKGAIEYARDITERKRAEESIKKYSRELEESNLMKKLFADIMHHDLLNPLSTASGFIEMLKEDETDPKKRAYLGIIERSLIKGLELIDSATRFSKLDSLESIEFEDMDLKKVIEEVIENLVPMGAKAGMMIENRITLSMPLQANKIIEEIFTNLISNAIKHAPQSKSIVVSCEDKDNFWRIKVIDNGEGIRDDDKIRIFERFRRMEKTGVKGSGLGLAIARKIVELHSGRIWVEDNPEGGAIFVVDMPKQLLETLDQFH